MHYTYEVYNSYGGRKHVTTKFEEACSELAMPAHSGGEILVYDNLLPAAPFCNRLKTYDELVDWQEKLDRLIWRPKAQIGVNTSVSPEEILPDEPTEKDHINPSHYQSYMMYDLGSEKMVYQWLESMQYLTRYRNNPDVFKGAVELQARKYIDRLGGKDESSQEIMKSVWYLKFLAAFIKNGNRPIFVKDIDTILAS